MNGGHGEQNNQSGWLTLRDGAMITLEEYRRNQQGIASARTYLAQMEQRNEDAYGRFAMAEQELRNRVGQGREAERLLAQLQAHAQAQGQHRQPNSYPMLPSTVPSQVALPTGYPAGPGSNPSYPAANAMELNANTPQFHQTPHSSGMASTSGDQQSSAYGRYYNSNVVPYGYQGAAHAQPAPYSARSSQHPQHIGSSEPATSSHTPQGYPSAAQSQASTSQRPARSQQNRGQVVQPVASSSRQPLQFVHHSGQPQPPRGAQQQSQPAKQVRQEPAGHAAHPRQPTLNRGQADYAPAVVLGISATAQGKLPQAVASRAPETHASNQNSVQNKQKHIDVVEIEQDIRRTVQSLDYLHICQVFRIVVYMFRDRMVRADGQPADIPPLEGFETGPELKRVSDTIADKMKDLTGPRIVTLLHKVQEGIKTTLGSAPAASVASSGNASAQASSAQISSSNGKHSTANQPAKLLLQPIAPHPGPAVIETPAAEPNGVPSQLSRSVPPRPSPPLTPSSAPRHAGQENVPSVVFPDLQRQPQTPQNGPRLSILTPDQADKTRLARDILKSLGRPSTQFLAQLLPASTPSKDEANANAKRKRTPSTTEASDKRQKTDGTEVESVSTSRTDANGNAFSSASPNPADIIVIQPASQAPLRPPEANVAPLPLPSENDTTVVEEAVEIRTPGALELALNEAAAAMAVATRPRQEGSPMPDAPPPVPIPASSPVLESPASGPPTSRSPSPVRHEAPNDDVDMYDANQHPSSVLSNGAFSEHVPPIGTLSESSPAPPTPVAGPSKQPLFYVSPDSPPDGGYNTSLSLVDGIPDFLPSGLLGGTPTNSQSKGKQRAHEVDGDVAVAEQPPSQANRKGERAQSDSDVEIIDSSDPEELAQVRASNTRKLAPRMEPYVLAPPPSEQLLRIMARRNKGPKVVRGRVLSSQESSDADMDEIAVDFRDEATRRKEDAEAKAVHGLCYSRLYLSLCQWDDCGAVLESAKRLSLHAKIHADEYDENDEVMPCLWVDCPRQYRSKERLAHHVQKHSLHPVMCAYAGCEFESWSVHGMVMHLKQPKHREKLLKPRAELVLPDPDYVPPYMPEVLPAYMTVDQPIRPAAISRATHAALAPKVLKNIGTSTPVGFVDKSASLRTPRRPKLSDKLVASLEADASSPAGPYDHWLLHRTGRVRRLCHDIPSKAVTDMFARGMVIDADWLGRGDPVWHPDWHEEDADGETDLGEDVSFEGPKPENAVLTVPDVEMQDVAHPEDLQESGPSGVQRAEKELSWEVLPGASEE